MLRTQLHNRPPMVDNETRCLSAVSNTTHSSPVYQFTLWRRLTPLIQKTVLMIRPRTLNNLWGKLFSPQTKRSFVQKSRRVKVAVAAACAASAVRGLGRGAGRDLRIGDFPACAPSRT